MVKKKTHMIIHLSQSGWSKKNCACPSVSSYLVEKLSPVCVKGLLTLVLPTRTSEREKQWPESCLVPAPQHSLSGARRDTPGECCSTGQNPHRIILNLMFYGMLSWGLEMSFCSNERSMSWLDLFGNCLRNYLKIPLSAGWGADRRALFSCLLELEVSCSYQTGWDVCEAEGRTMP